MVYNYGMKRPRFAAAHRGAINTSYTPNHFHEGTRVMADIDFTPKKRCSKCGVEKPATAEYFHRNNNRKDGLQHMCKPCLIAYQNTPEYIEKRKRREQKPERIAKAREDSRMRRLDPNIRAQQNARKRTAEGRERRRQLARKTPTTHMDGYVYILESANGLYKIGRASNAERRIKNIWTQSPVDLWAVCIIKTENRYELECQLHERFRSQRVKGEWFALTPEDVEYVKHFANHPMSKEDMNG